MDHACRSVERPVPTPSERLERGSRASGRTACDQGRCGCVSATAGAPAPRRRAQRERQANLRGVPSKSASTFFALALAAATGRRMVPAVPSFDWREQEFDSFGTLALRDRAVVLHSHTRYSSATRYFLREVGTPPVLIVRDLLDSLMSLWDHLRDDGPEVPMALVHQRDLRRDDAEMLDFLVDVVAVWYVQFFAGWMRASATAGQCAGARLRHRDRRHGHGDRIGLPACRRSDTTHGGHLPVIEEVRLAKPRFNQGTSGRGARFGRDRLARVERLAAFYPDVDFSPIGIGKAHRSSLLTRDAVGCADDCVRDTCSDLPDRTLLRRNPPARRLSPSFRREARGCSAGRHGQSGLRAVRHRRDAPVVAGLRHRVAVGDRSYSRSSVLRLPLCSASRTDSTLRGC